MNNRKRTRGRHGRRATITSRRRAVRRPTRRGAPRRTSRLSLVLGGIGATVVVVAFAVVAAVSGFTATPQTVGTSTTPIALQLVYTTPTANDAAVSLPASVREKLSKIADAHESIAVTRIDGDGTIETHTLDMTPRTGENPTDPALTVPERSREKTQAKIAELEQQINEPSSVGGRSLFKGMSRTDFTGAPVILISSLIDLSSPTDFRTLNWNTDPDDIVAISGESIASIEAPVTFVVVPTGGDQPQLGAEDKSYAKAVWSAVLLSADAAGVTFVEATTDLASPEREAPSTPIVEPQPLPDTPITPEPDPARPTDPTTASCTIPGSYFAFAEPDLLDYDLTVDNLSGCIEQALAWCSTFEVHGWASYEGELTPDGQPTHNDPSNQLVSERRVETVVTLLTTEFDVAAESIVTQVGHGNLDLPIPDNPSSPDNRVVRISYTSPANGCGEVGR